MFSNNKINFVLVILCFYLTFSLKAQVQLGISYGNNYDFGNNTPKNYKSNAVFDLHFIYQNETLFSPYLTLGFSKIPLNNSDILVPNQGNFKTNAINNSTAIELGMETILKKYNKSNISAKFGFGVTILSNPFISLENSNSSFIYLSTYDSNSETNFPFLTFALKIDREIAVNWKINLSVGTDYYPRNNSIAIKAKINSTDVEVRSSFTALRPHAKIGLVYSFIKK